MAELKTKETDESVKKFLDTVEPETKRKDAYALLELMKKVTGFEPKMWGPSIVGFGSYHYKYDSGHEGDTLLTGFSPRKQNLTLYVLGGYAGQEELLQKLGKHKTGKGCLYINKLSDVDTTIIEKLIKSSVQFLQKTYPQ